MTKEQLEKRLEYIKKEAKKDAGYFVKKKPMESVSDWFGKCFSGYTNRERLMKNFNYTDEQIDTMQDVYNETFWKSFKFWQVKMEKVEQVLEKYKSIFSEAEEVAKKVDVSDIKDGFPCGWCTLYLASSMRKTDLGEALRVKSNNDSYTTKVCPWSTYKLPIKTPIYGQCISFSERICEKVAEFLNSKGIQTSVNSYID